MTNSRNTRNALISSIVVLALCFSMLLGTTFAWFTDAAASNNNIIAAGTLDVELWQHTGAGENDKVNISDTNDALFGDDILWEPNRTEVRYLSIKNNGTLALKYKVIIDVESTSDVDLAEVMEYAITPNATYGEVTSWAGNGVAVQSNAVNATQAVDVDLLPGDVHYFALSIHMDKDAGNKYQAQSIKFDVTVLATQMSHESGSLGSGYDANAEYPYNGSAIVPFNEAESAQTIVVKDENDRTLGSVTIPKEARAGDATGYKVEIKQAANVYSGNNFTVENGKDATTYEVTVTGLKENNNEPVQAVINYIPGLATDAVKLYHYDELIDSVYDPSTGYVKFTTTGFSPFTVVADVTSVYEAPVIEKDEDGNALGLPVAEVVADTEHVGVDLPWGKYGSWSPTEGLDSVLEAAYVFRCTEDLDAAKLSPYANWYCDFYIMLNQDLGENEIFLGGNYGSFGWVGFHNGDVTLDANTEIGLLESVTENPWTYLDVVNFVGEFTCGVGDVDNALSGATFTVMLRLTNPDDSAEFYNIKTITYTFE